MERKIKPGPSRLSLKTGGGASCLRLHSKLKNRVQFLFSIPTFTHLLPVPEPSKSRLLLQLNCTEIVDSEKKKVENSKVYKMRCRAITSYYFIS